jgi:hypothetical protein
VDLSANDGGGATAQALAAPFPAGNCRPHRLAAVNLASDEAAFVHGTVIDLDGGRTTVAVIAS